jgi:hypothetical protein
VLVAAHRTSGAVEREPITLDMFRGASRFALDPFIAGCGRHFRAYLQVGLALITVYALSAAAYIAFVVYGYRAATDRMLLLGWTFIAALAAAILVAWITVVNLLYLLTQIALAVDGKGVGDAVVSVGRFIRAEFRELAGVFAVVLALVAAATLVSALAWSGVGLIAFVPLVGLAVIPLQLAALLIRGLVFEYLGLTALTTYVGLYVGHAARRAEAPEPTGIATRLERPAEG